MQGNALSSEPLREVENLARRDGEEGRRWFSCDAADLFVWWVDDELSAFEFCYDKSRQECSVRWSCEQGLRFFRIDDGEDSPLRNRSPVAWPLGDGARDIAAQWFELLGAALPPPLYRSVLGHIWLGELIPTDIGRSPRDKATHQTGDGE